MTPETNEWVRHDDFYNVSIHTEGASTRHPGSAVNKAESLGHEAPDVVHAGLSAAVEVLITGEHSLKGIFD